MAAIMRTIRETQHRTMLSCVYCGSTVNLTNEHVAPFSLGGEEMLLNGSCRACAKITSSFEQTLARTMLGNFRLRNNAPSYNKKRRPSEIALEFAGGKSIMIGVDKHPGSFILPLFDPPRLVRNAIGIPGTHVPGNCWMWPHIDKFGALLPADLEPGTKVVFGKIRYNAFTRFLAKVAYCHCVSMYGLGVFKPLLIDLILGRTIVYEDYIGGIDRKLDFPASDKVHPIAIETSAGMNYGTWFLRAVIHLFPQLNGPSYEVVVGTCVDQSAALGPKMPGSGL